MKTNIIITLLLIVFAGNAAFSQRHIKGLTGIEAGGGLTGKGNYFTLGYSKYLSGRLYLKVNGNYEFGKITSTQFKSYYIDIAPAFTLFNIKEVVFFNAVGGIAGAYDKPQTTEGAPNQSGLTYGGLIGCEAEIFLGGDNVALVIDANQRYYFNSKMNSQATNSGSTRYFIGAGLKIMF